jgi:hypothetical protein
MEILISPAGALAADGDTAVVNVYVREFEGDPVEDGTTLLLTAAGGTLCATPASYPWPVRQNVTPLSCAESADAVWPAILKLKTYGGVASALVRTAAVPGTLTIAARSGSLTGTKDVAISAIVAPAQSRIVGGSSPDTVVTGQMATVTAFLTTPAGEPVQARTRVLFSAVDTGAVEVTRQLALTQDGYARTAVRVKKVGSFYVRVTSGTVVDSIRVVGR